MMITRCPPEYTDKEIIRRCDKGLSTLDEEDFSIIIPATNWRTEVHYANRYCAICHNDSSAELWELTVSFFSVQNEKQKADEEILSTLRYNTTEKKYSVNVNDEPRICSFDTLRPEKLTDSSSCRLTFVWSCPMASKESTDACPIGTGNAVCVSNYHFINAECARCNNYTHGLQTACDHFGFGEIIPIQRSSNAARTLFKIKKSPNSNSCSIPAIAKYYCR